MGRTMSEYLEELEGEQISIDVGQGDDIKTYTMPKAVLCGGSKWFESALKQGRFEEGITRKIRLPDDCPDVMACLFYYMYQENLTWPVFPEGAEKLGEELLLCMKVWTTGDKYFMPGVQDASMLRICALLQSDFEDLPCSAAQLARCYEACHDGWAPRALIADYVVDCMEKNPSAFSESMPLSGLSGFLPLLHASEKLRSQSLSGDFPRYNKPRKHSMMLKVTRSNAEAKEEEEKAEYYGHTWDQPSSRCEECGYITPASFYCKRCESSTCPCAARVVLLCEDCEYWTFRWCRP